jgi:hypothetical protein
VTVDNPFPQQPSRDGWFQAAAVSALSMLPVVGPFASALVSEGMRQVDRAQMENWAAMLRAELNDIAATRERIELNDPAFVSAVRRLATAAAESADTEKRQILARAAANAGAWSETELDTREEYLALLVEMPPIFIRALAIADAAQELPEVGDGGGPAMPFEEFSRTLGGDVPRAQRVLISLQQRGLFGSPMGSGTTSVEITRFGVGLLAFLRQRPALGS